MSGTHPIVHEATIDGIQARWVDAPGPLSASLWFRVGAWDESVLTRGVTHLVEHLALYDRRRTEHPFGGAVGGPYMHIHAAGSVEELQAYFGALCASLRALPTDRLDTEAGVLTAEGGGRGRHWGAELLAQFFGPNGPGLNAFEERGLQCLTAEEVQAWADRYCVRGNAQLLLMGSPPATLGIDLPDGPYAPYALPPETIGHRPAQLERLATQESGACLGALCERSTEAVLALEILGRRLTERLRHDLGLVYEVATDYLPLDDTTAYLYVGADARAGKAREMATEFLSVLQTVGKADPTLEELDAVRRSLIKQEEGDDATRAAAELFRVGWWDLMRYTPITSEALRQERRDATPGGVGAAVRAFLQRAGVVLPEGVGADLATPPASSDVPFEGAGFRVRLRGPGRPDRLIVGEDGISIEEADRCFSLDWAGLVLAERSEADAWTFLHRGGGGISLNPPAWRRARKLKKLLERHVPRAVRLPENAVRRFHATEDEDAVAERRSRADARVRTLRAQGLTRDAIQEALCAEGYSRDEASEALER